MFGLKSIISIRQLVLIVIGVWLSIPASAQFSDFTSGYLQTPSAEMMESGSFSIVNNYLNHHQLVQPSDGWHGWEYNTFGYGFNVTFWSRVEITYACVLFNGHWSKSGGQPEWYFNQDRHFAAKFLLVKEGWLKDWMPSVAVGISDPVTGAGSGEYIGSDISAMNGYFNRMYVVATKHLNTGFGQVGMTLGYQYNLRSDYKLNAPCAAVSWNPKWLNDTDKFVSSFRLIAEYDARTINVGCITSLYRQHFDLMVDLQSFRWISAGLRFRTVLK